MRCSNLKLSTAFSSSGESMICSRSSRTRPAPPLPFFMRETPQIRQGRQSTPIHCLLICVCPAPDVLEKNLAATAVFRYQVSRQRRLFGRRDARPVRHLNAGDRHVLPVLGTEDRGLALLHLEPVLAERVDDVRQG